MSLVIATNLPDVAEIRKRIEQTRNREVRTYLKAVYLFGASAAELCGKRCSGENKNIIYGPKGTDFELRSTKPPNPSLDIVQKKLIEVKSGKAEVDQIIDELTQEIPVAVFKIRIAKRRKLGLDGQLPYRLIALPMPKEFEPWTEDLVNYFRERKENYVFPENRQTYWHHISNVVGTFNQLSYPIPERRFKEQDIVVKKKVHKREFKLQALRVMRTYVLITKYGFDVLDLTEYTGLKFAYANTGLKLSTRGDLHDWQRYIKKLCVT